MANESKNGRSSWAFVEHFCGGGVDLRIHSSADTISGKCLDWTRAERSGPDRTVLDMYGEIEEQATKQEIEKDRIVYKWIE